MKLILDGIEGITLTPGAIWKNRRLPKRLEYIELRNCKHVTVGGFDVDAQGKRSRAVYLLNCESCEVADVHATGAATKGEGDTLEPGHDFQADGGKFNRFVRCVSEGDEEGVMEDRFSLFAQLGSWCEDCRAIGPVCLTGTAFCVERCYRCRLDRCYGRITGPPGPPRHVTVSRSVETIIDDGDFGKGFVGVEEGSTQTRVSRDTSCKVWAAEGLEVIRE